MLRQRLVRQLKAETMANKQEDQNVKASVSADLSSDAVQMGTPNMESDSHAGFSDGSNPVFVELMRQFSPLASEKPEAILRFFVRLDYMHMLGLCDDSSYVIRIAPLVPGVNLRFFGGCLRNGKDWEQCKRELLRKFFAVLFGNG